MALTRSIMWPLAAPHKIRVSSACGSRIGKERQDTHRQLVDTCNCWGLSLRADKLRLRSNSPGSAARFGQTTLEQQASMLSLGAVIVGDRLFVVRHRAAAACIHFWAVRKHSCCKASSLRARMQRLRSEMRPVLVWGSTPWHMRDGLVRFAEAMIIRMCKLCVHVFRPSDEPFLEWHIRTWRAARDMVSQTWGASTTWADVASAAAGVPSLCSRVAGSIVGRTLRWRTPTVLGAFRFLAGGGPWARRRRGRPRLRW